MSAPFPTLVELQVYQEIHCSQQQTDHLCQYLWQRKPELIQVLADQEMLPFPDNRDGSMGRMLDRIEFFLLDEIKAGRLEEISLLGMIDLIFEIDRRVRKSLGLSDLPILGKALAPTPEGPYPVLESIPITKNNAALLHITQKNVDLCIADIYESHASLLYIYCEHMRRLLRGGHISQLLAHCVNVETKSYEIPGSYVQGELGRRLRIACEL